MFTLNLSLRGRELKPSTYASVQELGRGLAEALDDACLGIHPRAMAFLLALISRDLRAHPTWTWIATDYEIHVSRNGP